MNEFMFYTFYTGEMFTTKKNFFRSDFLLNHAFSYMVYLNGYINFLMFEMVVVWLKWQSYVHKL